MGSEQVRQLPGGGTLAGYLDQVSGDPEAIRAVAKRWRGASGKTNEHLGALGAAVRNVDDAWQGASADGFVTYMSKYGRAGEELDIAVSSCANSLDDAAGALEDAKAKIGRIADTLLTDVSAYRSSSRGDTPRETSATISQMASSAAEKAKPHVDEADKAVSKAMKEINKYLGERKITFTSIDDPGDQPFVPGAGHTVNWERTVGYHPAGGPGGGGPGGGSGGNGAGGNGSGGGFGGYGPSGPPPPGGGPAPEGRVKEWIDQAIEILKEQGVPVGKMNPNDIWMIIQHESGGNPHAINNWDSNAAAGHPSKGLMQTIDPTFNSYKLPGHGDIYNPVDNIIAGVRYAISRYGSVSNVPGVVGSKTGSGYVGY
ncbi:transglycosylase SLT domain-containing protein [Streptosporangium sp. NPDC004379]|uniref:transglycosylase SLT domain-containing protein n=1 Tax=Streptosporangium sp. NPDC004379 TaxID=3366189 RepID=UPI00369112BE